MLRIDAVNPDFPTSRTRRLIVMAGLLLSVALFVPLAWPFCLDRPFSRDDLSRFHWPNRSFFAQCLADGDSPLWNPRLYCGFYLHGEGQVGIDHPFHRLLYKLFPLSTAFSLEVFLGYPVLFAGFVVWLKRVGFPASAAILGAMTFTFSEFMVLRYVHMNAIQVVAHLPWALWAIQAASTWRHGCLILSILTASQALVGYPQYLGFCLLLEAGYAVFAYRKAYRTLATLALAVALGLMMGAAQLLPHFDALLASNRARPSLEFLGMNSLHPMNLISIVLPFAFRWGWYNGNGAASWPHHESVAYLGVMFPATCAWLWIRRRELGVFRSLTSGSLGLGAIAIALSIGIYTPAFRLYAMIPGASLFRGPARYMMLAQFAASLLCAIAFADLVRLKQPVPRRVLTPLLWPVGVSVLAGLSLALLAMNRSSGLRVEQLAIARALIVSVSFIGAACGLIGLAARAVRWAPFAILLLVAIDSWVHAARPLLQHEFKEWPQSLAFETPGRLISPLNIGMSESTKLVNGYVALTPKRALDYTRPKAQRVACAAWELGDSGALSTTLPPPLPRVRLVSDVKESRDFKADLEAIDPETTALADVSIPLPPGPIGRAELRADRPGRIDVHTSASAPRFLVVSESHHSGWRVSIDGASAEIIPTYGDFLGCLIPAGEHLVQFRFDPLSARLGRLISLVTIGLLVIQAVRGFLTSRDGCDEMKRRGDRTRAGRQGSTWNVPA